MEVQVHYGIARADRGEPCGCGDGVQASMERGQGRGAFA